LQEGEKLTVWNQYLYAVFGNKKRAQTIFYILIVLVLIVSSVLVCYSPENNSLINLSNTTTHFFDIKTVFIDILPPILVFIGIRLPQKRKQWVQELDNYLDVNFVYNNQIQIKVERVPLASIANAREQAQAMIKALNDDMYASLEPMLKDFRSYEIRRESIGNEEKCIELHRATIELTKPLSQQPLSTQNRGLAHYRVDETKNEFIYWNIPNKTKKIINPETKEERDLSLH